MGRRQQQQQETCSQQHSHPQWNVCRHFAFAFVCIVQRVAPDIAQFAQNKWSLRYRFYLMCVCASVLCKLFIYAGFFSFSLRHMPSAEWPNQTYRTNLYEIQMYSFQQFHFANRIFCHSDKATTTFTCAQFFCTHNLMEWNVCCFVSFHFCWWYFV